MPLCDLDRQTLLLVVLEADVVLVVNSSKALLETQTTVQRSRVVVRDASRTQALQCLKDRCE
jgi:hypothetical protein